MSEQQAAVWVSVDDAEATAKLNRLKVLAQEAVEAAKKARREVMQQVSLALSNISMMMTNFSQVMSILGQQSDAFFTALIGMTLSTVSMLISISAALAASGVGIPAAAYIMGIAAVLNTLAIAKLVGDKIRSSGLWEQVNAAAFRAQAEFQRSRTPVGGAF